MSSEERRIRRGLFALLFFACAYFFGGSGFNQNATFDLTRALVEHHTIAIDSYSFNTADVSFFHGHTYVNKAPGLSFLAAVPYAVMPRPQNLFETTVELYLCTVAVCATAGAWIGTLLFAVARRLGRTKREALLLALVAGVATPLFPWSTLLFVHVPSAALMLAAFIGVSNLGPRRPLLAGAAIGLASTMNYLCIVVAVIFSALLLFTSKQKLREILRYGAGGAPFAIALLVYQHAAFGAYLRTSVQAMDQRYVTQGAWLGILSPPSFRALWGITFSPYRGLFYLAPVLLLALPGALLMARRRSLRPALAAICVTCLYFVLVTAGFNGWFGGWAIGPRYLIPIVPLLLVLMISALNRLRLLWIATVVVSLILNVAATAVDPQPPERIQQPLAHYELPALLTGRSLAADDVPGWVHDFYTGHTSTSRVTLDDGRPFRLHRPGTSATEWASFNLGELVLGAGSALSLLPFVLLFGTGAAILVRRSGRPEA